jgi:hypothetical protein
MDTNTNQDNKITMPTIPTTPKELSIPMTQELYMELIKKYLKEENEDDVDIILES